MGGLGSSRSALGSTRGALECARGTLRDGRAGPVGSVPAAGSGSQGPPPFGGPPLLRLGLQAVVAHVGPRVCAHRAPRRHGCVDELLLLCHCLGKTWVRAVLSCLIESILFLVVGGEPIPMKNACIDPMNNLICGRTWKPHIHRHLTNDHGHSSFEDR